MTGDSAGWAGRSYLWGQNMGETIRLSQCYSIEHGIEVKDDDSFYSKIELIATGKLSSVKLPGIQARIYKAWANSWNSREFSKYPVDTCIKINSLFEECCIHVLKGEDKDTAVANMKGLSLFIGQLDKTSSKDFKIFSGYDGRRWDFIAEMDASKAVLHIRNNKSIEVIMDYLLPFVPEDMRRYVIAREIENRHKMRAC